VGTLFVAKEQIEVANTHSEDSAKRPRHAQHLASHVLFGPM
jgi:hypothetical protein